MIECHGCGALHALIDRLTVLAEQIETALPTPEPHQAEPGWDTNPDGVPDTNHEKE